MHARERQTETAAETHPEGLDDEVSCLQLSLHDAQQSQELWFAQTIHVELTFLKETQIDTLYLIVGNSMMVNGMVNKVLNNIIVNKVVVNIVVDTIEVNRKVNIIVKMVLKRSPTLYNKCPHVKFESP